MARRAEAGDGEAHRQLVAALAPLASMLRVKNARLGLPLRTHELEDAVQNAVLALLQKLGQFDGRVPLLRWAYGIAVIELLRTIERRRRRREQDHPAEPVEVTPQSTVDHERLAMALATLDAVDRTIVELRHLTELPFDAIAARLTMPLNTVKSRYYRGLQRLRERIRIADAGTA